MKDWIFYSALIVIIMLIGEKSKSNTFLKMLIGGAAFVLTYVIISRFIEK